MQPARVDGPKIALHDPSSVGLSAERLDRIDGFIRSLIDEGHRPNGMVLVARHGKPVYCRGFGLQNDGSADSLQSEPVDIRQDTIFRIYSMSKPITSAALMMLHEEGRFLLTDPAWMYLGDEWRKERMRVWKSGCEKHGNLVTEPCKKSITVRQLLTHTSGLSYGFDPTGEANPVDFSYHKARIEGGSSTTLSQFVSNLASMPLLFQPGSCWHYGYNTDVCGRLVEAISGVPFDEFLQQRVFAPLGMVDTGFRCPPEKLHRLADCYAEKPRPKSPQDRLKNVSRSKLVARLHTGRTWQSGGGGLLSTMHDYMRFCQFLSSGGELDGRRLLSVKTIEWMATNHLAGGSDIDDLQTALPAAYSETQGPGVGFGLGFAVRKDRAGTLIGSVGAASWGGAANTHFWIDPEERLFAIWMTQVLNYNEQRAPARSKLQTLVYGSIADRLPFGPIVSRL